MSRKRKKSDIGSNMSKQRNTYKIIFFPILLILVRIGDCGKTNNGSSEKYNNIGQRFAMEPQDQTAVVGSRVTLPCRVIGKEGSLQWTKDDFGLGEHRNLSGFERYSMVGSDEEGDFSLDIYPLMLDDDARYQCQVSPGPKGQPGIRSRFAKLTVLVPPESPKIIQGDYLVTTEDREIELECISVGGKPAAEITWIDGLGNVLSKGIDYVKEPLLDSRRYTAKSILKLTPKKEHHNTTFTCQAQNTADRTYRSAKILLEVKYAPKVTVSVIGGTLAGGRISEGAEVRLSCHADANPSDISYRWYINDDLVVGDYTTEMIIHNVTRKYHDAIVKCEVFNSVGKSEESETLDISYGPIFRIQPKSVEADIGSTVTLSCDVDGNPPADIVWINEASDRIVETSPELTITAAEETVGRYYCKAIVMGFPEISSEAIIYLKRPPTITSPAIQFGMIGDNARLDCIAFSVPKAEYVTWTFQNHEINNNYNPDYTILEDEIPEGIRSTLVIRESQLNNFGRYNCTVVNEYGSDTLEIDFIPQKTIPMLMVIVGAISSVAVLMMIIMMLILYLKRGQKKLPPADVIPDHHITEKTCKESDRSSNISDMKVDIRSGSCEPDCSETYSATDSVVTRIATNNLGTVPGNGHNTGIPLAGPIRIPGDYRYSGDYSDSLAHLQQHQQQQQQQQQHHHHQTTKTGQHNNGYVPYVDYARDYSPPPQNLNTIRNSNYTNTSPNNNTIIIPTSHMNGQIPSGNLSLTRNRNDPRQDNGLPNVQNSLNSLQGGLMAQPLLQNGLNIDPRYNATYGNPYLRTSNVSLPPLPPPSTANPSATPAPPPYHHATRNHSSLSSGNSSNIGLTTSNNSLIIGSTCTLPSQSTLQSQQQLLTSPSGQFIIPANGNLKKGSLATHV